MVHESIAELDQIGHVKNAYGPRQIGIRPLPIILLLSSFRQPLSEWGNLIKVVTDRVEW
jgi:hypothetical protein